MFPSELRGAVKHSPAPRKSNSEVGRIKGRMPIAMLFFKENVKHLDAVSEGEEGGPRIKKKVRSNRAAVRVLVNIENFRSQPSNEGASR